MRRSPLRLATGLLLLTAALMVGARGWGPLPPLGPLLDPANGIWAVARAAGPLPSGRLELAPLAEPVDVVIDRRGVPHIYAATEVDAYRALGYLVARDRLFQLELQTRAGAGRLTELLGRPALETDRQARRLGFTRLVERIASQVDTASRGYRSVRAYAEGINAWIDGLRARDLPLEYRLLGARPSRWEVRDTYYLLARMALTLAFNDPSLLKAEAAARVGWPAADALFPPHSPIQEPIQPNAVDRPRYAFGTLPPAGAPDSGALTLAQAVSAARRFLGVEPPREDGLALGSNNWAVAPSRSASGYALLAGDPHLELTLPSIWYQAHLVARDGLDVQGVTLPGAPWVIIGFNRDVAWSFTNTGSDVNDFYREAVDDLDRPTRYRVDGAWRPLEIRPEAFLSRPGDTLAVDTLRFTHRGPLLRVDTTWMSMAWTIYDGATSEDELTAAARARSVGEFLEAMKTYEAPAQNMLVADRRGTIAIRSTGLYPTRPGQGRGDVIQDGTLSSADWVGSLPLELYPFSLNPGRGFLSSANQQPVDPAVNGHYLGANWYGPWRALRINELLRADPAVTPDAMRRFQTDTRSARAAAFLPFLLGQGVDSARLAAAPKAVREARRLLAQWDLRYDRDDRRAVLFEAVMRELVRRTWDELADPGRPDSVRTGPRPDDAVLLDLFHQPQSPWWDDRRTSGVVETREAIVEASLAGGLAATIEDHGPSDGPGWRWGSVHHANIYHLLRLPALSALGLEVNGGPSTLSPSSGRGTAGPSWRMVVELGPEIRAWATYPGGQSGNPASPHYLDLLPAWLDGRLDSLITAPSADAVPARSVESRLHFVPRR